MKLWSFTGFVFLSVALFSGFFVSLEDLPRQSFCVLKHFFEFDCPGCGLTRAFIIIPQGSFVAAWHFNPASWFLYALFLWMWLWQVGRFFGKSLFEGMILKRARLGLGSLTVFVLMGQWGYKLIDFFLHHDAMDYMQRVVHKQAFLLF